jgi:multiple sugar transport system permease protein
VLFTVPITAAIAIVIAHLLNQKSKLNAVFQTAYFMPMVTTATAVGLVWRWMFNQNSGLINAFITFFTRLFGAPENINWLQTGATNHTIPMTVLIIFGIWNSLPFTIILLLSGLQNIDEHLYTVAKVDGSGPARIFFKITVPLLSPTIGLVLIINSISAFKVYTDVFVLWNGKPEDYQMETVAWYIYNNITSNFDGMHSLGIAAAAAMVLFVIIFAFTMLQKFIQRKWVYQ